MRIFSTSIMDAGSAIVDAHASIMGARSAIAIAMALAALAGVARAQVPVPPPGPPPLTRPSVPILPGAPSMLVSLPAAVATPLLTPVPIPTAMPTPAPRLFNCSCFTTASGTQWSGTVTASDYASARSTASGDCVRYLTSTPQSPFIPPGQSPGLETSNTGAQAPLNTMPGTPSSTFATTSANGGQPPGTGIPNSPLQTLEVSPSLTGQTVCNVCACN